jgi:hypothetical protein
MRKTAIPRPSPAMVVAICALVVAMSGTGYAAVTVTGKSVKDSSLTGKDVKNSSLTGTDIKNSSLAGVDVKNNSLTGSDVVESSLGKVGAAGTADRAGSAASADRASFATTAASAASADNAATVGGARVIPFVYRSASTATETVLATVGGMELRGSCGASDNDLRIYNRTGANAEVTWNNVADTANTTAGQTAVLGGGNSFINPAGGAVDTGVSGQASFVTAENHAVRILYTLQEASAGFACSESGVVIG